MGCGAGLSVAACEFGCKGAAGPVPGACVSGRWKGGQVMARVRRVQLLGLAIASTALLFPARSVVGQAGAAPPVAARATMDMGRKLPLLNLEQVQKELKITEEQKEKIAEFQKELREKIEAQEFPSQLDDLSREEREKRVAEVVEKRKELVAEAEENLEEILKPKQATRLGEIALQLRGVDGLKDKDVAEALDLSEEQVAKIGDAIAWEREEQRKLFQSRKEGGERPDQKELMKKMEQIRTKAEAKALEVLTDAQESKYEKMKGAAFKLAPMAGAMGGGFGGSEKGKTRGGAAPAAGGSRGKE